MMTHKSATREEWLAARLDLLKAALSSFPFARSVDAWLCRKAWPWRLSSWRGGGAHGKRRRAGSHVPIADGLLRQIAASYAEPTGFLIGAQRDFCRRWPNQEVVTVQGSHLL